MAAELSSLSVCRLPGRISVDGIVKQDLQLYADSILSGLIGQPSERSLDLLTVSAGVYAIDKAFRRGKKSGNLFPVRSLPVRFSVQDIAFWSRPEVSDCVAELLCFLSDDNWEVSFQKGPTVPASPYHQLAFDVSRPDNVRRVALYSGGLDSAAGLASKLLDRVDDYMLVTIGHHTSLRGSCLSQTQQLTRLLRSRSLSHVGTVVRLRGGAAARMSLQESSQRTRAFLFCATAAVAAISQRVDEIEIFENGIGAINVPVMSGMLSAGLGTRGSHPTFLRLMSNLASEVAERAISYRLPFFNFTKGQVLRRLAGHQLLEGWVQRSRSCIHTSIRQRGIRHCGQCPACIERRQAFVTAGIKENLQGYGVDIFANPMLESANADYFRCYRSDMDAWLSGEERVQRKFDGFLRLTDVPTDLHPQLVQHQVAHASEANKAFGHLPWPRSASIVSLASVAAAA